MAMKSLALYVDKWYIIGAVCIDGIVRSVNLPNHEDRIWLYFYEDVENSEISYGKLFQQRFYNNENHYYGDVFSKITSSNAKYVMFKRSQPMKDIFKSSKIFDDLRKDFEDDGDIHTFLSFSKDISLSARKLFMDALHSEKFIIHESAARIEHLALEFTVKKSGLESDGYYLVLSACNENLHYSLYQKSEELFVRKQEEVLKGMGTDIRSRALIEYVVDSINSKEGFLKTREEREYEYCRMNQFVDDWIVKLNNAKIRIPVQLNGITFSKDSFKDYAVSVPKIKIDERTESIVKGIIDAIAKFVKDSEVVHNQINGIVLLGSSFTNIQFRKALCNHYNLTDNNIVIYKDADLSSLVSVYSFIDCSQFSAATTMLTSNAEAELQRIKNAEADAAAKKKAKNEADAAAAVAREKSEAERKFKDAMSKGYDSERNHEYDDMVDYFKIALDLCLGDEEAKQKYNEALQLKAKQIVLMENYKGKIQQAKKAFENQDWEVAKQKAEEALGVFYDSVDAKHIKDESLRHIKQSKELERYLDRMDLFIAQKSYKEAMQELDKAKLLDVNDKEIIEREKKIKKEMEFMNSRIHELSEKFNIAYSSHYFDDALNFCHLLIEADPANYQKWAAFIERIKTEKKDFFEAEKNWKYLNDMINNALFLENWEDVVSYTKSALEIREDETLSVILKRTEDKLSTIQSENNYRQTKNEVIALMFDGNLEEAKAVLTDLRRENPSKNGDLKPLFRQIFEMENKNDRIQISGFVGSNSTTKTTFFTQEEPRKESFNKSSVVPDQKKKTILKDDFFDMDTNTSEISRVQSKVVNKDFDF